MLNRAWAVRLSPRKCLPCSPNIRIQLLRHFYGGLFSTDAEFKRLCPKETYYTVHAGNAWYTLSAMRVVNQALGRVIRHKDDFGAIILADERFARGDMQKNISYWARQLMTVRSDFGDLGGDLKKFFRENEKNAPPRPKNKARSGGAVLGEVFSFFSLHGSAAWMFFYGCLLLYKGMCIPRNSPNNSELFYLCREKWHGSTNLRQIPSAAPLNPQN